MRNSSVPGERLARGNLLQSLGRATSFLLTQRAGREFWRGPMVSAPAQSALYVAAASVWRDLDAFELALLDAVQGAAGKAQTTGERDLIAACVQVTGRSISVSASQESPRRAGYLYRFLARTLKRAFSSIPGVVGFPWYPTLFDLAIHHWTFAPLRRCLAVAVLDLLPALGMLLEAGARRTAGVRFWRGLVGRFGRQRRERRMNSLNEELYRLQEPNGCWSWTAMGTACSLLAARTVGNSRKAEVDRGLRYLDGLRTSAAGERAGESWAGAAVWDSARAAEILLLSGVWKPQQCLALGELLVDQIHEDGLCGFDLGIRLGDHDSSSAVLAFLGKTWSLLGRNAPSWLGGAVESLVDGLLSGQHGDGGWGFAPGKPFFHFGAYPPGELKAMTIDASSPDLTARVLLGLSAAVRSGCLDVLIADQVDHAVQRGLKYLEAEQDEDGSWWARWSEGRVLSTAWVLVAVCAAAADPKDPMTAKGRAWILANAAATDIPAEISSCLAALIVTSEQNRIDEDSFIRDLTERIISGQEDGTWKSPALYPLVYGVDRFSAPLFDHCTVALALLLAERGMLKGCEQARREILWGRLRARPLPRQAVDSIEMARVYQEFLELGQRLAGAPTSIGQRIVVHYSVYRDSRRNLTFPVLALHGAGWAQGYFDLLGLILPWYASLRFPFSWRKRDEFKNKMSLAMTGFEVANQRVLRDTFANYHFSKQYGTTPGADKILAPTLLTTLNRLHAANSGRESLTDLAKSTIYSECFQWEQHNSVWPMVEKAIKGVNDPLVKAIAFRPIVHFRFFPPLKFLLFHNFTDTNERIAQGWKAYGIAEEVGWAVTERAIGKFDFVPLDMTEYYVRLLDRLEPPKEFER